MASFKADEEQEEIMKRAFIFFLALVMIFVAGCGNKTGSATGTDTTENDNPVNMFNDENAVTVVSGNLSYSIPGTVAEQYDETYKDVGADASGIQTYEIPSFGTINIYFASLSQTEMYVKLNEMVVTYLDLTSARIKMRNIVSDIFPKDKSKEITEINGKYADGYDMYTCTEQSDIDIDNKMMGSSSSTFEIGEQRIVEFSRGTALYLIVFNAETGCYNEQTFDSFLESLNILS